MQAMDMSNDDLIARYLDLYDSPGSKKVRTHRLRKFREFTHDKPFLSVEYDEYLSYFLHLKGADYAFSMKQNCWAIVKSFVEYLQEFSGQFINFPHKMVKWGNGHAKSQQKTAGTPGEINQILNRVLAIDYKRYVMFLLLRDTGMRPGELCTIKTTDLLLDERTVITGTVAGARKSGQVEYHFSEACKRELENYLTGRRDVYPDNPFLFPGKFGVRHDSVRVLQGLLAQVRGESTITPHAFRTTINNLRKRMGCDTTDRKILLNQKVSDVNEVHYVEHTRAGTLALYDRYYPY